MSHSSCGTQLARTICRNPRGIIEADADLDADGCAASDVPTVVLLAILALLDDHHSAATMLTPSLDTRGLALQLLVSWICCEVSQAMIKLVHRKSPVDEIL
jgi:hypothetical protein